MATAIADDPILTPVASAFDLKEHFEIIDGKKVELPPMSAYASRIAFRLAYKLNEFAQAQALGEAVTETLFKLALPIDRNRRMDVAFVSYQRWPKGQQQPEEANAWDVVPDLAAEVISPNDTVEDLLERIDEYFRAGVRCVWVVFPRRRVIYVYESEKKMQALTRADELEGGSVLPGFRLPLTALFLEESPPAESH